MRIALGLEYDGSGFCGWQSQPSGCAVQDHVESALAAFIGTGDRVEVSCAGRTDAGVHALVQVVHFDSMAEREEISWVRGVNRFLPPSVRVLWMRAVPGDFHARFSAVARTYRYLLMVDRAEPALLARKAGWFHLPLDVEAMRVAARALEGEHDFSAFRAAECQAKSPVKTLGAVAIRASGPFLVFEFRANAFLHHMVRNLVGALVHVGAGRLSPQQLAAIRDSRDRSQAPPTFSPDGLYFAGVEYDAAFGLPSAPPRFPFPA